MYEDPSGFWTVDDMSQLLIGLSIRDFDPQWFSQADTLDIWVRQADTPDIWRTLGGTSDTWVRQT
ncbi:MAG: hypothetical protein DDT19_02890 [Syntrophomonadaceae bacterium]|nr:hypothetical protein [Bacillota bacterium]